MHPSVSTSILHTILVSTVLCLDYNRCLQKMSNGCSVPSGIGDRDKYGKEIFVAACDRHDVCYACGRERNWSRKNCDLAFYKNMVTLCNKHFIRARDIRKWHETLKKHGTLATTKIKQSFIFADLMRKWLLMPTGTHANCLEAAKLFYMGVDIFAAYHYNQEEPYDVTVECHLPCAEPLGNPNNTLSRNNTRYFM